MATTEASKRTEAPAARCYHNRWHPSSPPCQERAVWQTVGLGNAVDGWTWCLRHAPSKDYRAALAWEEATDGK